MATKSLIDVQHLYKIYKIEENETIAVNDISIQIGRGEFVSIMGPSGSGKSTFLHILGLLDRPTKGDYFFDGNNIQELDDQELALLRNQEIGFIFQRFNLLKRTSVYENVKLPLHYSKIPKRKWHDLVMNAINAVGLSHRVDNLSSQLSGGESQRVAIARAIVNEPSVIFADEPTGNLDSKTGEQIMNIIDDLHKSGRTIVLITHETSAAAYANRTIKLKDGKLVSDKKQSRSKRKKKFEK